MCLLGPPPWQGARNCVHIGPARPQGIEAETVMLEQFQWLAEEIMPAFHPPVARLRAPPYIWDAALQNFGADGGWAMQSQNRFFDDLARVAAGALGTLSGVKTEVGTRLREQLEKVLAGMDLVSRDEFEAVKAMAAKARSEQEDLANRVAELESKLAALSARDIPESPTGAQGSP
jgi:BMFP domain-containing protein YqiC